MRYAILDIETTGGKYNEEGITEIAVYKFDGHEIIDQFISLVNPERPIQPFVINLTGITNEMLRNAPKFYEVAKRIVEITTDCILVAHNADFDYRILRTEFSRLGFEFERESLCTVELSQKLIPNQPSYSLGKLVRSLGIPIADRHRASGDAIATVKLFKLLLDRDTDKTIITRAIRLHVKKKISRKLLQLIEEVPNATGVYYLHDEEGVIIYIGKSKNIKKQLTKHFTSTHHKSKKIQHAVARVTYALTGSELIATLKEYEELKKHRPIYNKRRYQPRFTHALYTDTNTEGYITLHMAKADGRKKNVTTFTNQQQAVSLLHQWTKQYSLCQKLVGLDSSSTNCFAYTIEECKGACIQEEAVALYNQRVQEFLEDHSLELHNILIIDRGRSVGEKSVLLIEDGRFKGMGHFELNHQIHTPEVLRTLITPMEHSRDMKHFIQNYLRKNKRLKIIKLP